jgi:hypothetical protein
VKYLETERQNSQAPSMSAYFESIVRDMQARAEIATAQARLAAYYDGLKPNPIEEDDHWGRVGASSISQLED